MYRFGTARTLKLMLSDVTLRLDNSAQSVGIAAAILRNGGLVAMPTETVYGLAANALDPVSVESIFSAKGRPHWDPLIVHIASTSMLAMVSAEVSSTAQRLADAFWPGPLTMLLPRAETIGDNVTASRPLVGVRWPQHPVAQALILAAELPLAAPSANRFGHISPSTAAHVLHDLDGRIDAVLDGGPTGIGLESTVLDPNTNPITIYRQGAVSAADIERVTGLRAHLFQPEPNHSPESLPSPGVGIRHYAPRTPLQLVESKADLLDAIASAAQPVAVLRPTDWELPAKLPHVVWGAWDNTAELAHALYAALRELDAKGTQLILAPLPDSRPGDDLRSALRDRLLKAAMPEAK
jgi:L-threonylcarbamoyladenylate synthase